MKLVYFVLDDIWRCFTMYRTIYGCSRTMYGCSTGVCLYPIIVKTAEPFEPNFFVGPRLTPWEGFTM